MPTDASLRHVASLTGAAVITCGVVASAVAVAAGDAEPLVHGTDGVGVAMAVTYGLAGLWVSRARPRNPIGWLLLVLGGCNGLAAVTGAYARLAADRGLPAHGLAAWVASAVWVLGFAPLLTVLLPLAPAGAAATRFRRALVVVGAAGPALLTVAVALSPDAVDDVVPGTVNALAAPATATALAAVGGVLTAVAVIVALADAVRRLLRATSPEREQLAWLLTTLVAAFVGGAVPPPARIVPFALVPLAVAVGVVRHRLLDLQVVVRRTLLYTALTALIVVVFVAATVVGSALAAPRSVPVALAAAFVAVALDPVRDRLRLGVDRLVYGDRRDPVGAVARVGRRMSDQPAGDLLPEVVEAVAAALGAPGATCALDGSLPLVVGTAGTGEPLSRPLVLGGTRVGELTVAPRGPHEQWSTADRGLLDVLAPHVAVVARAVALAEEVARSRDAVVAATKAERDRLRRELHDGLGPALAGLALGLEAAESTVWNGPEQAESLLRRLREETVATSGELRRIVDALRPDVLDTHGLDGALRRQGRAIEERSNGRLAVSVETSAELPALPPDVEVAAHRVAAEALTNVVRHSRARACTVSLAAAGGRLVLRVRDDGIGVPDAPRDGVGLVSMRRRVESLGGTFRVANVRGSGTLVEAVWPLGGPS